MTIKCLSVSAQWVEDKRIPEGWTPHISSLALNNSEEERQNKTEAGVAWLFPRPYRGLIYNTCVSNQQRRSGILYVGGPIDQEPKRKERGKRTRRRGCVGDLLKVARLNKEWERARLGRNEGLVFLLRSWCAFFLFLNVSECPQSQTSVLDVDRVWQFGFMTAPSL